MSRDDERARAWAISRALAIPGWSPRPQGIDEDWADLVRDDGATIRIRAGGYQNEGRVTFRGCPPAFRDGRRYVGSTPASITCRADRSPAAIGKETTRRLLPAYLPEYAKALAYVRTHEEHAREARLVAERIADQIGADVGDCIPSRGESVPLKGEPAHVYRAFVHPAYSDTPVRVDFEVHGLDPEVAAEVLRTISESERPRAAAQIRVGTPFRVATAEPLSEDEDASTTPPARRMHLVR